MLDIKFIRENKELVKENIVKRQMNFDVGKLLLLDEERRVLLQEVEVLRAEQNKASEEIGKEKDSAQKQRKIDEMKSLKEKLADLKTKLNVRQREFDGLLYRLPNMLQPDVPVGKDERDNVVLREIGKKPDPAFKANEYLKIAKNLDLIDIERAAKVSGSRFSYLKNQAVVLEFALVKLVFDTLLKEGFKPVVPPVMIKSEAMQAMGYIDTAEDREERYFLEKDNLYLVGTSEQSIGPMFMNEMLDEKEMPLRFAAFSTCFRREAGSYGKDTKGILRVHQFDKIEMFSFCRPENSVSEHKFILGLEEKLMQKLDLPYRVVQLCSADLARPSSATYDIETWLSGQEQYRETHSCSNCTDFQARRLNIRFKNSKTGKLEFAHTLNGTAFAIGRMLIAILENCQQKDGSIKIPKVLRRWSGFKKIERAKK